MLSYSDALDMTSSSKDTTHTQFYPNRCNVLYFLLQTRFQVPLDNIETADYTNHRPLYLSVCLSFTSARK